MSLDGANQSVGLHFLWQKIMVRIEEAKHMKSVKDQKISLLVLSPDVRKFIRGK